MAMSTELALILVALLNMRRDRLHLGAPV